MTAWVPTQPPVVLAEPGRALLPLWQRIIAVVLLAKPYDRSLFFRFDHVRGEVPSRHWEFGTRWEHSDGSRRKLEVNDTADQVGGSV